METKILDNLGLVSQMFDELEIGKTIDSLIPQDMSQRNVSIGQCVKAMVLNGLGFVNQQLYLLPRFFESKPLERFFGSGVLSEHFNDDTLGRSLDSLFSSGLTPVFCKVSSVAMKKLNIQARFGHLDSTSFHVHGVYNQQELVEGEVRIAKGYSRDHRPDLKQIGLALIVEQSSKIPFLMKPLNGNSNDCKAFEDIVREFGIQLKDVEGVETLVADCALCTSENVRLMSEQGVHFVTRMPSTSKQVKTLVSDCIQGVHSLRDLGDGYECFETDSRFANTPVRQICIRSQKGAEQGKGTLIKRLLKESREECKELKQLKAKSFACEKDAIAELERFTKNCSHIKLQGATVEAVPRYSKPGRPAPDSKPDCINWIISASPCSNIDHYQNQSRKKGWFVLVSNQLDKAEWPAQRLLECYKNQNSVEQGFRFLKSPEFLCHSLYIKTPSRIQSLLFVMTLCLLVYSALEYKIRAKLKDEEPFWPSQLGKPVQNPTARWVFHEFHGIHALLLEGQSLVLNLKDHHTRLLKLLGKSWFQLYENKIP